MWNGWPTDRVLVVFTGLALAMIAVQVALFHYRGNFRHKVMWGPVLTAPILALVGLMLGLWNGPWLRTIFVVGLSLQALAALLGFILHVRGVMLRVGGWKIRNVLTGPPVVLPLMLGALSLLGLISIYWPGIVTAFKPR